MVKRSNVLTAALGFIAGYVDTVGFVALFGLFTAHVTGNFVLIGSALAHQSEGNLQLKLLVFPSFILSVALARVVVVELDKRGQPALTPLMTLQALLLTGFMVLGVLASPVRDADEGLAIAAGILGAAAMGVQNATGRLLLSKLTPTTVMTGNVTQLVIDVVDLLRGAGGEEVKKRSRGFIAPIVAFTVGAIGGGVAYVRFGFAALCLPVVILASLAYASRLWPASALEK